MAAPAKITFVLAEDKRAAKILTETFWASGGWKPDPSWPSAVDRAHAEAAGYMFPSVELDHDTLVGSTRELADACSLADAANSFMASLSIRRRFLRPFLASVVVAKQLPAHEFTPQAAPDDYKCAVCGCEAEPYEIERDALSFERHRWGGVRTLDVTFIWFALDCFVREGEPRRVTPMSTCCDAVSTCSASSTPSRR